MKDNICPYCGDGVQEIDSAEIYSGVSYGPILACVNYPECDSYGCVTLANLELRQLRKECHRRFDKVWKSGVRSRTQAYKWLCRKTKKRPYEGHIAQFREKDCRRLLKRLDRANELKTFGINV